MHASIFPVLYIYVVIYCNRRLCRWVGTGGVRECIQPVNCGRNYRVNKLTVSPTIVNFESSTKNTHTYIRAQQPSRAQHLLFSKLSCLVMHELIFCAHVKCVCVCVCVCVYVLCIIYVCGVIRIDSIFISFFLSFHLTKHQTSKIPGYLP